MTANNEAKQYLRNRLRMELRMSSLLHDALNDAAARISEIAAKYGIPTGKLSTCTDPIVLQEIQSVINDLIDELESNVEELCVKADESQKNYIMAYISTAVYTITLSSRISKWANEICTWLKTAYDHNLFKTDKNVPMKYGPMYGMDRLLRHTIARAWMEAKKQKAIMSGAVFFSTHRGSSYPCTTCDEEEAKGIQPIDNFSLPLHNNCCCYAVFYDENRQPI